MQLRGKQRRHLRALGHHLEPAVRVGKAGVAGAVLRAADEALSRHELIKVRREPECPEDRRSLAEALARELGAEVVQTLGRTLLLYRPSPDGPRIALP